MMKKEKGITLIALIITIIVMMILVGVSLTVALKGGLFTSAKDAAKNTNNEATAERELSNGVVNIDGTSVNIDEYTKPNS